MRSRVVSLIHQIIQNPHGVSEIYRTGNEYYFIYLGRYFSIMKRTHQSNGSSYVFYIYPKAVAPLEQLAVEMSVGNQPDDYPMVAYNDTDFSADEADLFRQLYRVLEERHLGLDELFNDLGA